MIIEDFYITLCFASYIPCIYSIYHGCMGWMFAPKKFNSIINFFQIFALLFLAMQTHWTLRVLDTGMESSMDILWEMHDMAMWTISGLLLKNIYNKNYLKFKETMTHINGNQMAFSKK